MKRDFLIVPFAVIAVALLCAAGPTTQSVTIGGAVKTPGVWTVDQLEKQFAADRRDVKFTAKGQAHTASGVPLIAVVQAAGVKPDPAVKNGALRMVVVIRANDGYAVSFGLADLLADFGDKEVWLATEVDGQPVAAPRGPMELIVPGDAKLGRWVHDVCAIEVVDPTKVAATRPASNP